MRPMHTYLKVGETRDAAYIVNPEALMLYAHCTRLHTLTTQGVTGFLL